MELFFLQLNNAPIFKSSQFKNVAFALLKYIRYIKCSVEQICGE